MVPAQDWVIYKYQMPIAEVFTMNLPRNAEIIRMADVDGMFFLWAVVNPNFDIVERKFRSFKCGGRIPGDITLEYRGFCAIRIQQELGLYIFEDTSYAPN